MLSVRVSVVDNVRRLSHSTRGYVWMYVEGIFGSYRGIAAATGDTVEPSGCALDIATANAQCSYA